jgi:hypothetical protein
LEQIDLEFYLEIYDTRSYSTSEKIANITQQIKLASYDTIEAKTKVKNNFNELLKQLDSNDKSKYYAQLLAHKNNITKMLSANSQNTVDPRIDKETVQNSGDRLNSRNFVAPKI